ncbi:hypothetical protein BH11PSE3_BH11PSE3_01390 [soil metagenome]
MDKPVASQVVDVILAIERELGPLATLSNKIASEEEQRAVREMLSKIVALYTELLMSIVYQYPELDPDRSSDGPPI